MNASPHRLSGGNKKNPPPCIDRERIHYVKDNKGLNGLLDELDFVKSAGVDIEANSFYAYHEQVCLVQIATERRIWVVDPLAVDILPLGDFFKDPSREVIFHAGEFDILSLKREFDFVFNAVFDTQIMAMVLGMGQVGYADLVKNLFGVSLRKGMQRSDWGQRPLSSRQLKYAAADTLYLLDMRKRLGAMLEKKNLMHEARSRFKKLESVEPRIKVFDPDSCRRIKGYRYLDRTGKLIVRNIFLEREKRAEKINISPFRVIRNELIIRIARKKPLDMKSLSDIRGIPEITLQKFGKDIIAAVQDGLDGKK